MDRVPPVVGAPLRRAPAGPACTRRGRVPETPGGGTEPAAPPEPRGVRPNLPWRFRERRHQFSLQPELDEPGPSPILAAAFPRARNFSWSRYPEDLLGARVRHLVFAELGRVVPDPVRAELDQLVHRAQVGASAEVASSVPTPNASMGAPASTGHGSCIVQVPRCHDLGVVSGRLNPECPRPFWTIQEGRRCPAGPPEMGFPRSRGFADPVERVELSTM